MHGPAAPPGKGAGMSGNAEADRARREQREQRIAELIRAGHSPGRAAEIAYAEAAYSGQRQAG